MPLSLYLKSAVLNKTLAGIDFPTVASGYLALFTGDPLPDASGPELIGNGYARTQITINESNGVATNNADVFTPVATGDWGVITHIGIFDAANGGNMLYYAQLPNPNTVNANARLEFPQNTISITI